ncbi:hypothetical protein SAMN02910340_00025 [Methanosarcina thermophila]|jgi:hypothetical protein|uniref:D-alanine--D-alanine ligase n=2 Tax=Methanosarcina thermophila TaxID=2210 RepID=A0A1I6X2J3_METTE|nr:hypothetical protein [Methanosarcina thermophila]AKB13531.1 hypothetical protein MSTHT_1773 [Methanosarcina thermophila TM-1]NLU57500.1 hypothetical protein [Methanosarcina thermophila]SFT32034.1 hypothetical protein SAMN02910340_00025 [Methanosarcina thermophila]BAW28536.1 conserved hypothetical protein [Methanosarcina thermophila]GLI14531.1 hypothetical protein MTHERMMSTA1_16570 [Methanosarcina thermophila MST-A1]
MTQNNSDSNTRRKRARCTVQKKTFEPVEDLETYVQSDWRLDAKGKSRLLEVNPNPGWCWDDHLAKMATYANISYLGMLAAIIEAAKERYGLETTGKIELSRKCLKPCPGKARLNVLLSSRQKLKPAQ